jgi:hypothetical protein
VIILSAQGVAQTPAAASADESQKNHGRDCNHNDIQAGKIAIEHVSHLALRSSHTMKQHRAMINNF